MNRRSERCGLLLAGFFALHTVAAQETLPKPDPGFQGKIGVTLEDSVPAWPAQPVAPKGAPNVVLILLDDVGFGASATFGGPAATPDLDRLASEGLRYNRFHTTALCSPTRAALLTGRNHHQAGFGVVIETARGYPGYNGYWRKDTVSVAEVLRRNGYSTAAFGKWHNTPAGEITPVGPYDRWPTHLGFEYFYGFQGGETNQWEPQLYRNTEAVEPRKTPEQGYHLTADLADEAIGWLRKQRSLAPNKPFFLYFATGATHAPLHVPKEWIDKYRGRFDQGWDKLREEIFERQKRLGVIPANTVLTPRPKELPAWDSLSPDQKRLYARQMEVYAAFLSHTDYEVGRLLGTVRQTGQWDNTLVLYVVGDNGGSAEGTLDGSIRNIASFFGTRDDVATQLAHIDELGSPLHDNHYAVPWAWATNSPFQWTKQVASHFGGTRNPLVVSWPARIKQPGGLRSQFHHVNDVAPTIYEAAGITFPETVDGVAQIPLEGKSLLYSFNDPNAPDTHTVQYFEMFGNRAVYKDGWLAGARHGLPWELQGRKDDFENDRWELYHVAEDFSQAHDLAAQYPDKLKELQAEFDKEAWRNNVYPLSAGLLDNLRGGDGPSLAKGRSSFVYTAGSVRIPDATAPRLEGRAHRIVATVDIPPAGAEGVLVAHGGRFGGYSLYLKDGRLVYETNTLGRNRHVLTSTVPVPAGRVELGFEFQPDGNSGKSGIGRLFVNGQPAGEAHLAGIGSLRAALTETFDVGEERGSVVSNAYAAPYRFTGTLEKLTVDLQ